MGRHTTSAQEIIREWDPIQVVFPDPVHLQPSAFAGAFKEAFHQACIHLDLEVFADYVYREPYLATLDLPDILERLNYRFLWSKDVGARHMSHRPSWCGRCNRGAQGVTYYTRNEESLEIDDKFISFEWDFSFLFKEENGLLMEWYECRMALAESQAHVFN